MLRRPLAIALLCVHAVGALHLALAAHVTGDSGAVVDAQPSCPQSGHGSAGIAHGHELQREESECHAVALLRAAAEVRSAVAARVAPAPLAVVALFDAHAQSPVDVLSVAPKSSPPV